MMAAIIHAMTAIPVTAVNAAAFAPIVMARAMHRGAVHGWTVHRGAAMVIVAVVAMRLGHRADGRQQQRQGSGGSENAFHGNAFPCDACQIMASPVNLA
jgi:hypothetical protein